MLHAIIRFSIKNKLIVGLMVLGLIVWGSYELTRLPIDAVPDITNNQVLVITSSPSLGAPDVERFITVPVEQATRNIPGIIEQRSFSRFGLSLVTIVFNDATDVYWARQQVSERLAQVRQQIPAGMGEPSMGPVTTGLGEIFQYVVKPKPGYEGKYDIIALRDIQDWLVRRQLLGTEGVADVSSFGGAVKQYEVAIHPEKLLSYHLTIGDVYSALQQNNQNAGGAYIEKGPNVLFIRTEGLVENLKDIGNIVIKNVSTGVPLLVKDVADVKMGEATRYGAMVYNNQMEVAGAVVMMLKGANSNIVINNIKQKINEIQKALPEGIEIVPFLDRTKMVNNAISTVEHNLMEGALIVVFVLVLFLGNMRAGLIVASVIPLAMLFAVIMMNLFGVSGNLMSLGALDFGLLVDGAVIIVEAVMHKLSHSRTYAAVTKLNQHQMDAEVQVSANKMMNSAVFGQIIILIVYLPVLTLEGIEGKMFRPMAETVSFAIIGAFILSLTYIPMVSSLMLSKKLKHNDTFSDKMIARISKWYQPLLKRVLKIPGWIVAAAFVLFAVSVIVMNTLGGEFIPQLEEGDFAVDTRLLTGSSLNTTIETTEKTAGVLLSKFPEVEKVVTKIGSGEIPTDPMSLEAADMMVILKDKKEWTSAHSFPELADKMSAALEEVPGVATGFQFPVQMRFNELMTGARQDVVCKIFGDDLDTLAAYSDKLASVIQTVQGAKDLYKETVTGIPQMVIKYNRDAMSRYGANVEEINRTIQSAYAGAAAGLVFEADRRYDLVIRMDEKDKMNINAMQNLPVALSDGSQVPLNVLASVQLEDGPYQIQREDARRRISVGFNVRNRDVQSIVKELQQKVGQQLKFPPGYYITYGGQYENLQHATQRLSIAVPLALVLIFLMLFFAFNRVKYGLLIFSAIPLSAIGGIFALWLRSMPFSISAGIGFIALFGVSVLNGIVLISEMNRLKAEGMNDIKTIIMQATKTRLRPVLMTATVASLGFFPMAISNGAGAEVQRPLATVVIGGLVTATVLTLLVLPALYLLFERKWNKPKKVAPVATLLLLILLPWVGHSQQVQNLHLAEAINMARKNSLVIKQSSMMQSYYETMQSAVTSMPNTQLSAEFGQINSIVSDNKFSVTQGFALPVFYNRQREVLKQQWESSGLQKRVDEARIVMQTKLAYLQLQYTDAKEKLLQQADSIFNRFLKIAQLRYEKGETNLLEKVTIENKVAEIKLQLQTINDDRQIIVSQLQVLLHTGDIIHAADTLALNEISMDTAMLSIHPELQLYTKQEALATAEKNWERSKLLPEFLLGYSNQSIIGNQLKADGSEVYYDGGKRFSTVQVGVGIPLFNRPQKARIKASEQKESIASLNTEIAMENLRASLQHALQSYAKYRQTNTYYQLTGLPQASLIIETAGLNYKNGQVNYIEWGTLISSALNIKSAYIDNLQQLNEQAIQLEYLLQQNN